MVHIVPEEVELWSSSAAPHSSLIFFLFSMEMTRNDSHHKNGGNNHNFLRLDTIPRLDIIQNTKNSIQSNKFPFNIFMHCQSLCSDPMFTINFFTDTFFFLFLMSTESFPWREAWSENKFILILFLSR